MCSMSGILKMYELRVVFGKVWCAAEATPEQHIVTHIVQLLSFSAFRP